mgnify:CR=1 FL=1
MQENLTRKNLIIIIVLALLVFGAILYNKNKKPAISYDEYLQMGINYETKGELNNAIEAYKKAAKLSPKEYVPYSNIGSAYFSLKQFPEAETAFLKAIELTPNNVSVYTKLYDLYYHGLRRYPHQMNAFFEDAMRDTNNDINIVKLYASYLEEINDPESALPIWQSLLQVEPDNASYKAKIKALQKKINPK